MRLAVYPGSFDPLTLGHVDIIKRAARLTDTLLVSVVQNPKKQTMFTLDERRESLEECLIGLTNVKVSSFAGLLVHYLAEVGANCVIKGLRNGSDFEGELQMARLNAGMWSGMETVFLAASPLFGHLSSTWVREIAALGGDYSTLVPPSVAARVQNKLKPQVRKEDG